MKITFTNRSGEKVPYTFHRKGILYTNIGGRSETEWTPDHPYYLRNVSVKGGSFEKGTFEFDIFQGDFMVPIIRFKGKVKPNTVVVHLGDQIKDNFVLEAYKTIKIYQHTDVRYSEIVLRLEQLTNTEAFLFE
jgi:hypothetical protein